MPFIEPLSDANLEGLALEHIIPALLSHGFYYVDGLLGDLAGGAVLDQVKEMHRSGKLQDGQLAGSAPGIHRRSIRGDKIAWVSGSERGCEAVGFLLNLMDKLVSVCGRRLGGRTIRERSQVRPRPGSDPEVLVQTLLELRLNLEAVDVRPSRAGINGTTEERVLVFASLPVARRDTDTPSQVKQNQNQQTYPVKTPVWVSGVFFLWIF